MDASRRWWGDAPRLQHIGTASVATSKIEPAPERHADGAAPKRRQIERSGFSARHRSEEPLPLGVGAFGATGPGPRTTPRKSALMYDRDRMG